jgi:hypothetical protein
MREAVSVIAEMRDSDRLRRFLETGSDRACLCVADIRCTIGLISRLAGEFVLATRQDWPRGLNQLGNTCYLNSLLQVRRAHSHRTSGLLTHRSTSTQSRTSDRPSCPYRILLERVWTKTSLRMMI